MFTTVLVALDGSPRAPRVLFQALALAERSDATIHVCHAVKIPVGIPEALWRVPLDQLDARLLVAAEHRFAELAESHSSSIEATHVRVGPAADVVVALAAELGADLVVIGANGYGRLERLLGTTASKIVHRAPCSVLVVRRATSTVDTPE